MGCDIHLITQVRQSDGTWEDQQIKRNCRLCKVLENNVSFNFKRVKQPVYYNPSFICWNCLGDGYIIGWRDRNYDVFAALADVRNANGIVPISEPRGIPAGFHLLDELHNEEWLGDHSFSWLTLAELEAYDWFECSFADSFIPALQALGKNSEDVRIVFGFDS